MMVDVAPCARVLPRRQEQQRDHDAIGGLRVNGRNRSLQQGLVEGKVRPGPTTLHAAWLHRGRRALEQYFELRCHVCTTSAAAH